LQPDGLTPEDALIPRLSSALKWDLLLLASLITTIALLARHRFFTPEDIDGSALTAGTAKATLLQSIIQNTLEQTVIAFMAHVVWALTMPLVWQGVIPVAAVLFVVGRLLFGMGYASGAPARALGFALTFYPTVLMTLAMIVKTGFD